MDPLIIGMDASVAIPLLEKNGFACEHIPASWRDIGTPENGPKLVGHDEYNFWSKIMPHGEVGTVTLFVTVTDGRVTEYGTNPNYTF